MVLYAGPLQILYERGFLRYISYRDTEILRMIYFVLRDEATKTKIFPGKRFGSTTRA
jgi:D-apionolactonase